MTRSEHAQPHPAPVRPNHIRRTIARARRRRKSGPPVPMPIGARLADAVASAVGSWRFIVIQSALLALWITGNAIIGRSAWDPFPFILLNLLLSFQAAYTAPIIMMSQNRLSDVDREHALADYQVNIRAEAEIALLHEKIDLMRERELMELTGLLKAALARIEGLEGERKPA